MFPANSLPARAAQTSLVLLILINMMNYIDRYILAAVAIPVMKEYGLSESRFGLLTTAFLLSYMFLSPAFGMLAGRFSRWSLVGFGLLLWSMASAGTAFAIGLSTLLIARCLIGVGEAAYGPIAPTLIADLYPVRQRGKMMALFYAAIPVGSALGYSWGGLFHTHWKWAFYLTLIPGLILATWAFSMRDPRLDQSAKTTGISGENAHRGFFQPVIYAQLLRNRSYMLCTAGMMAMTFALGGIAIWMPTYLEKERHLTNSTQVNMIFGAISAVAGLLATVLGGMAGDALGKKHGGAYFLVSGAAMILGTPLFVAMLFVPFPYAWGLVFLAVFCLFFNTGPSNTILANVTASKIRATAFATNILLIHALGDAISPPIIGKIAELSSFRLAFILVSIMILVGGILWILGAWHLQADTARATAEDEAENNEISPENPAVLA